MARQLCCRSMWKIGCDLMTGNWITPSKILLVKRDPEVMFSNVFNLLEDAFWIVGYIYLRHFVTFRLSEIYPWFNNMLLAYNQDGDVNSTWPGDAKLCQIDLVTSSPVNCSVRVRQLAMTWTTVDESSTNSHRIYMSTFPSGWNINSQFYSENYTFIHTPSH